MVDKATTSAVDEYIQQTVLLTRSIVFKSSVSAERLNKSVIAQYGEDKVDLSRPSTWKYYMNIAGQYHFTDQPMTVISLDTQQTIDYTVENLRLHIATAEAYRYGTRYYFALVRRFPEQEHLIMAINNPADIWKAIQAQDGDILAYYRYLVEPQEDTLIYHIENYIKNYLKRYTVAGFQNVWKAYPVLNYSILYQSLCAQIMNIRLEATKTAGTHSFHITQYLASHGHLDRFIPYMTLKQKLYLYHNIDFIEKYAGFTDTFEELIQWILNDRYIPLASYTVRQLQEHNDKLYPELRARRSALGTLFNTAEAEYIPIESLYDKEKPIQEGNPDYYKYHEAQITHSLATDDTSVIQTKDLESAMVDYTDAVPDPLTDVLLRQWAYMSCNGMYDVLTNFVHPLTGDRISIMASEALTYYSYIWMTGIGKEPTVVPEFIDMKFRLHPKPSVDVLFQELVTGKYEDLRSIAINLTNSQPVITPCFSTRAFFDLSYKIFEESQKHWFLTASIGDPMERGIVAKMVSRFYGITCFKLAPDNTSMNLWLGERGLPRFEGTYEEAMQLCMTIFQAATGYTIDETKTLRSIQKAMIDMFKQLSSYTIQVMREINDSAVIPVNWAAIRVGVEGEHGEDALHVPAAVEVIEIVQQSHDSAQVNSAAIRVETDTVIKDQDIFVNVHAGVTLCNDWENSVLSHGIQIADVRIYEETKAVADLYKPFLPNTYYESLTESQKLEIARRFTNEAI